MPRKPLPSLNDGQLNMPPHPIISDSMHRDTLDRVAHLLELLELVDLSAGVNPGAQAGLYWIHSMMIDSLRYVSDGLKQPKHEAGLGKRSGK